jgi:hypothetical protein
MLITHVQVERNLKSVNITAMGLSDVLRKYLQNHDFRPPQVVLVRFESLSSNLDVAMECFRDFFIKRYIARIVVDEVSSNDVSFYYVDEFSYFSMNMT